MYRPSATLGTQRDVVDRRVLAFVVDLAVVSVPVAVLAAVGGPSGLLSAALFAVGSLGYFGYLEGTYGQTVGKRLLGIVVVRTDGSALDVRGSVVRNVARLVDAVPVVYLVPGAAAYYADRNRQRVGDVLADTLVVAVAPHIALETTEAPAVRTA